MSEGITELYRKKARELDEKLAELITEMEEFDEMYTLVSLSHAYCFLLNKINNSGEIGEELLKKVNQEIIRETGFEIVKKNDEINHTFGVKGPSDPMYI